MTIELRPELEQIIREQLSTGHFKSVDEVLTTALAQLPQRHRSNRLAVRRMLEFSRRNSVRLPAHRAEVVLGR